MEAQAAVPGGVEDDAGAEEGAGGGLEGERGGGGEAGRGGEAGGRCGDHRAGGQGGTAAVVGGAAHKDRGKEYAGEDGCAAQEVCECEVIYGACSTRTFYDCKFHVRCDAGSPCDACGWELI